MSEAVTTRSEQRAFGGVQGFYEHASVACAGPMRFGVYLPPAAERGPVPAVYYLAGLECNEQTFAQKAGAQRVAAELGLALVTPDTSPRSARFPGDDASWDFGQSAGFYLDATAAPWSAAYRMETYLTAELRALVESRFPIAADRRGLTGHSMGGHGALTLSLRHRELYSSVSALAPICSPCRVPWGEKAFSNYLGPDRALWRAHDTTELVAGGSAFPGVPLIDVGLADKFLSTQLQPELLEEACRSSGRLITVRRMTGYDHSYYFVSTFIEDHLRHHAAVLLA